MNEPTIRLEVRPEVTAFVEKVRARLSDLTDEERTVELSLKFLQAGDAWREFRLSYRRFDPKSFAEALDEQRIRVICHRNYGVGSDGILLGPLPSQVADFGLRIINPDGSVAKDLWIMDISITMGLVSMSTTPMLLKLVAQRKLAAEKFATHHFTLDQMMDAYDTFGRAAETKAMKLAITR